MTAEAQTEPLPDSLPPDAGDPAAVKLREFALEVQWEVGIRNHNFPPKSKEDERWKERGPVAVSMLDTVHRYLGEEGFRVASLMRDSHQPVLLHAPKKPKGAKL